MSDPTSKLYETADDAQLDWKWPHFSAEEFRCNGTGRILVVPSFMSKLELIRAAFNKPMIVTSGYRAPSYNVIVSKATGESGPHTTGRAVDIAVRGSDALELFKIALSFGMTGFGLKQHGEGRFLHLDDLTSPEHPRPTLWGYP